MNNSYTSKKVDYQQTIPDVIQAMGKVHLLLGRYPLDSKLVHLVMLRVSQINRCAYCIQLNNKKARDNGESQQRLDSVMVCQQKECFSRQEKLAFEWTEVLTYLQPETDLNAIRQRLEAVFTQTEIDALTALVAMIYLWNRLKRASD